MRLLSFVLVCSVSFLTFAQELNIDQTIPDHFDKYSRVDQFLYLLSIRSNFDEELLQNTDLYLSRKNSETSIKFVKPIKTSELEGKKLRKKSFNLLKKQFKELNSNSIHLLELESEKSRYKDLRMTLGLGWVYEQARLEVKYKRLTFLRHSSSIMATDDIPIYGMIMRINANSEQRSYSKVIALHSSDFKLQLKNGVSNFQSGITVSIANKYSKEINYLKNEIKKAGLKVTSIGYELISKKPSGSFYMPRNLYESKPDKLLLHSKCNKIFNKWL